MINKFRALYATTCVLFGACLWPQASAQSTGLTSPGQNQGQFTQLLTPPMSRSNSERACAPSEYGDPYADCIPLAPRNGSGYYGDYTQFSPLVDGSVPRSMESFSSPRDDFPFESSKSGSSAKYEKEPLTEFQKYVASAVGQVLPIYGTSLFQRVPTTFGPLDRVSVSPDYVISPGDELQIAVWGQFSFARRLIVGNTGEIVLPDAGPTAVAGLNYSQAAGVIKGAMSRFYKNFDVSVTLGRLHTIQIFVVGEARRPGSYNVSALSTLVSAVFAAGGPSSLGSMRNLQLKRRDRTICEFDLYDLLMRGDKTSDVQLMPGDVILIPPAGPRIAVSGSVERAGIYEVRKTAVLSEALKLADGMSPLASSNEAILERVVDGSALRVLRVPLNEEGLSTPVLNGDIIRLLPVVQRFENAVTLRGNIGDPGRFPWHAGMRLSDLIPDKNALLTRDYWKERNRVIDGSQLPDETDQSGTVVPSDRTRPDTPAGNSQSSSNVELAFVGFDRESSRSQPAYRELPRATQGDSSFGAATGLDGIPPLRMFVPRNTIQPAAPDINWEYASIERMDPTTLATHIIPFRLGKLVLAHDASEDVPLEPGDVVTVFSKADFSVPRAQQPVQVRLEGEIAMAGVYTARPGETLRQLVDRAGGLTHNAYLYGAQFTRESTRREQQKRYDDFLSDFERQVNEAASNLSSRVTSPQQAATAQTSVASQRDLVERLRKVAMNGRIVLDMQPNSHGETALPDLPLENGDRLYVPSRPSTVNVIGTVFEQSSFLYQEDFRTGDYLKKAGGPARSADRGHMFVIRADGSVVSRQNGSVLFAKSFDALPMYPGDTLVVPTYINKATFLRDLIDWSQVFSNLALGAAAVNVLH